MHTADESVPAAPYGEESNIRKQGEKKMQKYECPCGYEYDPETGDLEHGIQPGTAFEDLPEDWVCPWCGAAKEYFEKKQ